MNLRIPERSSDFLFIVPLHSYLTAISQPPLASPSFLFFSFSRKRDKQERAGIDLSEALHEHQQRSANKSKRVGDPPKRAPSSI